MTESDHKPALSSRIMDVWRPYDDFDDEQYVEWLLREQVREYADADLAGRDKELADIAICALRMLAERGRNPEAVVRQRLKARMEGNQEQIIARYKQRYAATAPKSEGGADG